MMIEALKFIVQLLNVDNFLSGNLCPVIFKFYVQQMI